MTPELQSLARRAVACNRWRWIPGMRWVAYRLAPLKPVSGRVADTRPRDGGNVPPHALPDLTDPATLGCLLALVREAWHEATTQIDSGRWWVAARDGTPLGAGATEAAALVAALEAAPTIQESRTVQGAR